MHGVNSVKFTNKIFVIDSDGYQTVRVSYITILKGKMRVCIRCMYSL
jgi:hypothetical protein